MAEYHNTKLTQIDNVTNTNAYNLLHAYVNHNKNRSIEVIKFA